MSNKQDSNIPWWLIVLGFIFFPPAGIVLLLMSLGGVQFPTGRSSGSQGSGRYTYQQRRQTPPTDSQVIYSTPTANQAKTQGTASPAGQAKAQDGSTQRGYVYGRPGPAQKASGARPAQNPRQRRPSLRGGRSITTLGVALSLALIPLVDELASFGFSFVDTWLPLLGCTCAGIFMIFTGLGRTRTARRYRLYLGVIGQQKSVFLSDLAGSAGVSEKKVLSDVQRMLADGILPMGYIDRASGRLVLTDQGYEAPRREAAPSQASEPPKAAQKEDDDDAILREIKEVNDAIPGDEMSRKIDRIGEITRKILAYQRNNPSKAAELRQFLNYYLPTTLKILRAYAQMDAQGVEGENISAAKKRIEEMMDKVVEGFEKQLDQLFQTDAMDITTDVEVLERMLDKDGLGSGMTLGS